MKLMIPIALSYSAFVFAHGDHSAPGALPFAPHGGKVGTAEHADAKEGNHKEEHAHKEGEKEHGEDHKDERKIADVEHEESELYFEAVYNGAQNQVEVYSLTIDPKVPGEFTQRNNLGEFADIKMRVEFPRSKKVEALSPELKKDPAKGEYWAAKIPFNKDIRFFVHIDVTEGGEKKLAKVHLEKRR